MAAKRIEWRDRRIGELVAEDERRAAVFAKHGLDFCCGGGRTVGEACEEMGVDYDVVAADLDELDGPPTPAAAEWTLGELVDLLVSVHHARARENLPLLRELSARADTVHGDRHAELREVRELVESLSAEMERHMAAEEQTLFPTIERLLMADRRDGGVEARIELASSIDVLEGEHDRVGGVMRRLRAVTGDFQPPPDVCATYRTLYGMLAQFEADLYRHVHLENNVLFPRALALAGEADAGREAVA